MNTEQPQVPDYVRSALERWTRNTRPLDQAHKAISSDLLTILMRWAHSVTRADQTWAFLVSVPRNATDTPVVFFNRQANIALGIEALRTQAGLGSSDS